MLISERISNYIEKELEQSVESASPIIRQASLHLLVQVENAFGQFLLFSLLNLANIRWKMYPKLRFRLSLSIWHHLFMMMLLMTQICGVAETVKAKWDNRIAMYTGDYIFSRALLSIGEIEIPAAHQLLAKTMLEICEGEIIQIEQQREINQTLRDYLRRIKRKTALLFLLVANSVRLFQVQMLLLSGN